MTLLFDSVVIPEVAVQDSDLKFPVRRIYCVGQNYRDHVRRWEAIRNRARQYSSASRPTPSFKVEVASPILPPRAIFTMKSNWLWR